MGYEDLRKEFSIDMKLLHNQRLQQLKNVDNTTTSESIKSQMKAKIFKNFDNKIRKIQNTPGYQDAKKKHLEELRRRKISESSYQNDGFAYYGEISKQDAEIAAQTYGEGYQPLTDFLTLCFKNNIHTFACCKGHPEQGNEVSYIFLDGDNKKIKRLVDFIINKNIADNIGMNFDIIDNKKCLKLGVYVKVKHRQAFYERCIKELSEILKKENDLDNTFIVDSVAELLESYPMGEQARLDIRRRKVEISSDTFTL